MELGVAERVADPLGGQRIAVIAGVARQRPARPVGGAEEAGQVARAGQARGALSGPQPLGQPGHLQLLVSAAAPVRLHATVSIGSWRFLFAVLPCCPAARQREPATC